MVNDSSRYNAQNTFDELLNLGTIPIVNENDTVSTSETVSYTHLRIRSFGTIMRKRIVIIGGGASGLTAAIGGARNGAHVTIVEHMDRVDVYKRQGMLKARINCEDLEASMRTSFPEITWVSARVSGTRLLIHIKENEVLSTIPEKDETPCDIVASQPGVITSMVVRQGVAQVCVGDQVEEGQVLVSGRVPIIGDNEEEINAYMVHAEDVYKRQVYSLSSHYIGCCIFFLFLYMEILSNPASLSIWYTLSNP